MSRQSPFIQQFMPHCMPQSMGQMPHTPGAPPQYQMMPGMFHHNNYMIPPHQMPLFATTQGLPPLSQDQDQNGLTSFDDFYDLDYTKCESFEDILNDDSAMAHDICGAPDIQKPLLKPEQTGPSLQKDAFAPIKPESIQPFPFVGPEDQPREEKQALTDVGTMPPLRSPPTNATVTAATVSAEALTKAVEEFIPVKRERKGSFVLLSP